MDRPQGDDWWLASDGKWYPPEARPAPPPPPPPSTPGAESAQWPSDTRVARLRGLSRGLTGTLGGFLWASAALYALSAVLYLGYWGAWDTWSQGTTSGAFSDLLDAEAAAEAGVSFASLAYVVTIVLFIIWHNQAYKAAESRGVIGNRWSSGWAVGGWFIPFANLVIPKLVMNEVERMSSPDARPSSYQGGEGWRRVRLSSLGGWWWGVFVATIIMVTIGTVMAGSALDDEVFGASLIVRAIAFGGYAAAGVLAAIYVRRIGRNLYSYGPGRESAGREYFRGS